MVFLAPTLTFAQDRLRIVVIEGESGVNIIQQKTAVAPVIEVRDRNNNPVAGATVTFAIKGGSSKAVIGNGLRQLAVTTDAAGRATAAINPVANGAFEIQVNAAFGGQTASATIAQTNVATAAEAAKAAAGGGGHTGLIVTTAVIAGGGIAAKEVVDKYNGDPNYGCGYGGASSVPPLIPAAGGSFSSAVTLDCDWSAASDQPWLTLTGQTSGTYSYNPTGPLPNFTFTFTAQPNTSPDPRMANIVVTLKGLDPLRLPITQSGTR